MFAVLAALLLLVVVVTLVRQDTGTAVAPLRCRMYVQQSVSRALCAYEKTADIVK